MPSVTIYLDRELQADIKRTGVPLSLTCQRALRRQVRIAEKRILANVPRDPGDDGERNPNHGRAATG